MTRLLLIFCLLVFDAAPSAAQDDVASFYKGKTVRLLVGIGVGSGYDINARVLARHLSRHIPGEPTIIVQNQPGAGSLIMTNQLYVAGPFDGTAIGASFNGMPTTSLLQPTGVRSDPTKLNRIGSTNRETQVAYVWHTAPTQKFEDARSIETDRRRAGAGLDPVRLSGAAQSPARVQIQGHHGLREHAKNPSRDGARRGARNDRQLVNAQGNRFDVAHGEQDPAAVAVGPQAPPRSRRHAISSTTSSPPNPIGRRLISCWRGLNMGAPSSCRRMCRLPVSPRCAALSRRR